MSLLLNDKDNLSLSGAKSKSYYGLYNTEKVSDELVKKIVDMHSKFVSGHVRKGIDLDEDFMRPKVKREGYEEINEIDSEDLRDEERKFLFQYPIKDIKEYGGDTDIDLVVLNENDLFVIELKSGGELDTGKSENVVKKLRKAVDSFENRFSSFKNLCIKDRVVFWKPSELNPQHVKVNIENYVEEKCMTGREFCDLFDMSFEGNVKEFVGRENLSFVYERCKNIVNLYEKDKTENSDQNLEFENKLKEQIKGSVPIKK